jgi:hypothetical protein
MIYKESLKKVWLAVLLIHILLGHVFAQNTNQPEKIRKNLKKLAKRSWITTMKKLRTVTCIQRSKKDLFPFPLLLLNRPLVDLEVD